MRLLLRRYRAIFFRSLVH